MVLELIFRFYYFQFINFFKHEKLILDFKYTKVIFFAYQKYMYLEFCQDSIYYFIFLFLIIRISQFSDFLDLTITIYSNLEHLSIIIINLDLYFLKKLMVLMFLMNRSNSTQLSSFFPFNLISFSFMFLSHFYDWKSLIPTNINFKFPTLQFYYNLIYYLEIPIKILIFKFDNLNVR